MQPVFDLNGVLVHSQYHRLNDYHEQLSSAVTVGNKHVWVRPYAHELLLSLNTAGIKPAIWSSMHLANVQAIVDRLFANIEFAFVWGREHCDTGSNYTSIKDVSKISSNCVLFDDTPEKVPAERRSQWWPVQTYTPDLIDDTALSILQGVLAELRAQQ